MRSSFRNLPLRYGLGAAVRSSPKSKLFGFATARGTRWSGFHSPRALGAVQPYLLADIGEGITECQIMSWAVKPGDRVAQFEAICEVQSDKAAVEITSRYEGIVRKLHYEVDDMARVGSPLIDIEMDDDAAAELTTSTEPAQDMESSREDAQRNLGSVQAEETVPMVTAETLAENISLEGEKPGNPGITTPAVRRMLKEHAIDILSISGTGKDGRVLKEDVQKHLSARQGSEQKKPATIGVQQDQVVPLSPIQTQMFQSMTKSLAIPHFLFTQIINMTPLSGLRRRLTTNRAMLSRLQAAGSTTGKVTALPFILKALSEAIKEMPMVNSSIDLERDPKRPHLVIKSSHNIGVAMDTPKGLLVPVIHDVQSHSIVSLQQELHRLGNLAREGRLSPADMKGATIVVSNIGSLGGHVVAPIILDPTVMIIGVGRSRIVPAFEEDEAGQERIVKREEVVLSWSADHRVLDGATVAKCADKVGSHLENPEALGMTLV